MKKMADPENDNDNGQPENRELTEYLGSSDDVQRSRIAELEEELQMKDELLHKAGQLGKTLLEQNAELQDQMDKGEKEFLQKLERRDQDHHALQTRYDQRVSMERVYLEEIEGLKLTLESARRQIEFQCEADSNKQIHDMKKKNESLQMEVDRLALSESQLQTELAAISDQMATLKQEMAAQESSGNQSYTDEMGRMLVEIQTLRDEKEELRKSVQTSTKEKEQMLLSERHLRQEVTSSREEVEEKECQITSYQNALEKCREEVQDLQVQLEVQRMETMNKAGKGNSLFAEVEDRRVQAELELSKLRAQFDTMKKKHTMVAQQMHRYQSQMLVFMQSASSQIDESRLKKLERDAYVHRQQIEQLTRENTHLRNQEKEDSNLRAVLGAAETLTNTQVNDFMKVRLENKSKELDSARKELASEKYKRMSFESSVMEKESELYDLKKRLKASEAANAKLKLDIEKMKLKYEPESLNVGSKIESRHVETIPLVEITDKIQSAPKNERRLAVSDSINITDENQSSKTTDLVDILSKPKTAKRVKISEDVVVKDLEGNVAMETVAKDESLVENGAESVEKRPTEQQPEKKRKVVKGTQQRNTLKVSGENPEQCNQQ